MNLKRPDGVQKSMKETLTEKKNKENKEGKKSSWIEKWKKNEKDPQNNLVLALKNYRGDSRSPN